jgi:short subunit dehydrogenase-like uncharacterized protein
VAVRRVPVDQLVGAAEIAGRLRLADPRVVHAWHHRHPDFPEPVAKLKQAMVWAWPDVEKWARTTGRYPKKGQRDDALDGAG